MVVDRSKSATSGPPLPPMNPRCWGVDSESTTLKKDVRALLRELFGNAPDDLPEFCEQPAPTRGSRLTDADLAELRALLGDGAVTVDDEHRLRRARGKSTADLLSWRYVARVDCPDAVIAPASEDDIAALLQWCERNSVAIVPFGGGTSVVGGVHADTGEHRAVLSLDMAYFDEVDEVDSVSGQATLGAGLTGPEAEAKLAEHGFSLGHFPQSFRYATIGGFAMTRSSGQSSAGYGRFDDMVCGLTMVTPGGILRLGRAPASAAGPDLRQLMLGSEGIFGICTQVQVRIHPIPETVHHEAFSFADFATGTRAVRAVAQSGAGPTVIRLSDETETSVNLAITKHIGDENTAPVGCLCVTQFEGSLGHVDARHSATRDILLAHGGQSLGPQPAQDWEEGRFDAPALRDALLDARVLCETVETACTWAQLGDMRTTVVDSLTAELAATGTASLIMSHISHVYPTGASLYFTVVAGQRGPDPVEQWRVAKRSVTAAIVASGGTVTHHHAVGRDHREFMTDEIGQVGVAMLRAMKDAVDPHGICNPGVLLP